VKKPTWLCTVAIFDPENPLFWTSKQSQKLKSKFLVFLVFSLEFSMFPFSLFFVSDHL